VKFHDDKSLYTGVHAKGGPTTVDEIHPSASFGQSPSGLADQEEEKKAAPTKTKSKQEAVPTGEPAANLEELFSRFTLGQPDMDSRTLVKVAKDCKIIGKKVTTTDCDLVFSKVKAKGSQRINYNQFEKAIEEFANKQKTSFEDLTAKICAIGGPTYTGTKAEAVKYHDDKSLYTGVHGKGGPSTTGDGAISDIS